MDANKKSCTTPFINNLEIIEIFKDKNKEEEVSVNSGVSSQQINSNYILRFTIRKGTI